MNEAIENLYAAGFTVELRSYSGRLAVDFKLAGAKTLVTLVSGELKAHIVFWSRLLLEHRELVEKQCGPFYSTPKSGAHST